MATCLGLDDFVRVGVLSGPRHCSDRGPEAWASPAACAAGWYQVHLVRLGTDVPLGIRWPPRGRGSSWVVPAPSAHAEGRVGLFPSPPLLPPPVRVPSPADSEWSMRSPLKQATGTKQPRKDAIKLSACQASYPSTPAGYYDDPQPLCKYRFVPDPLLACIAGN